MNKPVIFYHLWPVGEYDRINKNIFSSIVKSGLAKNMEKMYICVNSDIEFSLINTYDLPHDKIEFIKVKDTQTEWPTLEQLYVKYVSIPETPILYLHCKGARFNNSHASYDAINSWTEGMTYFNVDRWKKCVSTLCIGKLTAGIRVETVPVPHYSGNFWWINSTYLRALPDPRRIDQSSRNRYGAEFWIGRVGIVNLNNMDNDRHLFNYSNVIYKEQYIVKSDLDKIICVYNTSNDLRWLNSTNVDYQIYTKGDNIKYNSYVEAYLTYIVDNYYELPRYTYFISDTALRNIPNFGIILKNNYIKFNYFGTFNTKDTKKGLPNHPGLDIESVWNTYFNTKCPDEFSFVAGSVFGVTSEEILKYPITFYKRILETMSNQDHPKEDYCFERMWKYIFTQKNEIRLSDNHIETIGDTMIIKRPRYTMPWLHVIWDELYDKNKILETIMESIDGNSTHIAFIKNRENDGEFSRYISSLDFDKNPIEYTDKEFSTWKICIISLEYVSKNKTKKKKIIQPMIDHIEKFMV